MASSTGAPQALRPDPNRLGVGRFRRHDSSFLVTTVSLTPNRHVPTPGRPHLSPPGVVHDQPSIPVEASVPVDVDEELLHPANGIDEPPTPTDDRELALTADSKCFSMPLQGEATETGPPAEDLVREIMPRWAMSDATFLLFGLCVTVLIAVIDQRVTPPSLPLVSLSQITGGVGATFAVLIDMIIPIFGWISFAPQIDCAIPWKGGRIIPELTSPGLGDSKPWLYRTALGLTAVPADAVLDPRLPHWAFPGDSGHLTLELHTNATISAVIIESDFPESMPHDIRVWAFVPKIKQSRHEEPLSVTPSLLHRFEDRGLFPLFLGNISIGEDSVPGDHRYRIHRRARAHTPTMVVMLEFLSNGGADITRIRLIRILGSPS